MAVGEGAVGGERLLAGAAAVEHGAQLAPAGKPEVEGGADALGGQRQAVPGGVPGEEDAVLDGRAQLVGDPVALVALGRQAEVRGEPDGRLLDVMGGPEGADADAELIARRGSSSRSRRGCSARRSRPRGPRRARRVDLESAREAVRSGGWIGGAVGQHAPPAERVDDQRRGYLAPVGVDGVAAATGDGGGLEVDLGGVGLAAQDARRARGSRTSRTAPAAASESCGRACGRRMSLKLWRMRARRDRARRATRSGIAQAEVWRSPSS